MKTKHVGFTAMAAFGGVLLIGAIVLGLWAVQPLMAKIIVLFVGGLILFALGVSNAD